MLATALNAPFDIVISKTLAKKYFGKNTSAIGKTLRTVYDMYKVTGVIEDVPKNSHLRYDMLISMSTFLKNNTVARTIGATLSISPMYC